MREKYFLCLSCKNANCDMRGRMVAITDCSGYIKEKTATTSAKAVAAQENKLTPIIDSENSEVKEANYD